MSYLFNRKVQLAVLIVLLAAVVVSLLYGPANMLQNLIAEATGIALGVWFTVTLVERMLERRGRDRWQAVRTQAWRAISTHIIDIATAYMYHIPSGRQYMSEVLEGRAKPTARVADALAEALEAMRNQHPVTGT